MVYGPKHFRKAHFHKLPEGWKPSLLIKQASKHSELMTSLLKLALTVTSLVGAGPMTSSTGSQRPLMLRALLSGWLMCVYSALESHSCLKNTFQCVPSSSLSPGPDMQQTNSVISLSVLLSILSLEGPRWAMWPLCSQTACYCRSCYEREVEFGVFLYVCVWFDEPTAFCPVSVSPLQHISPSCSLRLLWWWAPQGSDLCFRL